MEIVVQPKVVRDAGGGSGTKLSFPMLTRGTYTNWAMVMEVNLQAWRCRMRSRTILSHARTTSRH
jgi:hypothetical protein